MENEMSTSTSATASLANPSKPGSREHIWLKRGSLGIAIILAGLCGLGAIYQAVATRMDQRTYLPPGQFVNLDGRRIHMLVKGNATSQPTVILEAGIAGFSSNWAWVQDELAPTTRVVAYDRAGLGWSDPATEPQDAQQSARDLHAALQAAGIQGPYVVAGHSYGGLVVRAFTDLYPDEVVGMVLVDASHPDQWAAVPLTRGGRLVAASNRILSYLAPLGVVRLFDLNKALVAGLPDRQAAEMKAILARPRSWSTSSDVLLVWNERSRPQINQARSLGDLPLVVLSATELPSAASAGGYAEALAAQQAELPGLSSNSLHLTVEGATHEGLVAKREYALVVVDAILRVLDVSQTGDPLAEE
jgi:pimeloyl-ACP methyl ester carboxylesterase